MGSVATKSIAVVRPREPIAPRFITALLRSSAYQDWFRGHARGATIQHLSVRTLRNLPVPVPELPIQERLVRHSGEETVDPFAALIRIVENREGDDPVIVWLEEFSQALGSHRSGQAASDPVVLLERVARSVRDLRNRVAHSSITTTPDLGRWIVDLAEAVGTLEGLSHVPPGPGRVAILDSASCAWRACRQALGSRPSPA